MARTSLPPGFRFHPTDVELTLYYLKRKIMGKPFRFEAISEIELYKFAPWDLPDKSCLQSKDLEWYFFCPADRKYANSSRQNRATDIGYWKITGKDRSISYNSRIVARKKTLVFHEGRVPNGVRTNWVMHEYRLEEKELADSGFLLDAFVLCKIYKKSGPGPKIGEQYGAPFSEEDWEEEEGGPSVLLPPICNDSMHVQYELSDHVQPDGHAVDATAPGSSECVDICSVLQEVLESHDHEIFGTQASEMSDSLVHGTSTKRTIVPNASQVELESADEIYFPNETLGDALEHDLLDLSSQAKPWPIEDFHSPYNSTDDMLLQSLLGISDGSYMEMSDFQLPAQGHSPHLHLPDNLSPTYQPSLLSWESIGASSGTVHP
ncbi:hypothetical protein Taro_041378 [Colocasia esculenta]|uniref:NAC domain-containing protein n=1 Tax=Colocasia esculenta TaxID=4460 RepID=A0A843WPN4_COLES|nr:hypothetical protein [Colocasia esculenta]